MHSPFQDHSSKKETTNSEFMVFTEKLSYLTMEGKTKLEPHSLQDRLIFTCQFVCFPAAIAEYTTYPGRMSSSIVKESYDFMKNLVLISYLLFNVKMYAYFKQYMNYVHQQCNCKKVNKCP